MDGRRLPRVDLGCLRPKGQLVELAITVTAVTDRDVWLFLIVNDCETALDEAAGHVRDPHPRSFALTRTNGQINN